jgi:hypothetical protein
VYDKAWALLKDDWDKSTITEASGVISAIDMPTNSQAYSLECFPGAHNVRVTASINDAGADQYLNEFDAKFPNLSATSKSALKAFAQNLFVIIVRVKTGKAEDSYQVLGSYNGLRLMNPTYDSNANGGQISGTFSSMTAPRAEFEPVPPKNFWVTSNTATIAYLDALLVPQS